MKNISHNLSGKFDRKTVAFFTDIVRITRRLGIPFFLVGAAARDILLAYVHGIEQRRATVDVDIGILVSDWKQFHEENLSPGRAMESVRMPCRGRCTPMKLLLKQSAFLTHYPGG